MQSRTECQATLLVTACHDQITLWDRKLPGSSLWHQRDKPGALAVTVRGCQVGEFPPAPLWSPLFSPCPLLCPGSPAQLEAAPGNYQQLYDVQMVFPPSPLLFMSVASGSCASPDVPDREKASPGQAGMRCQG